MSAPGRPDPQPAPPTSEPLWLCPGVRVATYAVVLAALSTWACFDGLAGPMLRGDESNFSYTTEHMLRTGDYVVPYINWSGRPHLNATPMYNWLSCLTADVIGEGNLRHRFWSAAFGVASVLATLVLGALLFGPEVGFLAGLLLGLNVFFVYYHGARWAVMDAALTFFVTAMVICYSRTGPGSARPGLWWAGAGVCMGLAVLTKPPAMGGFLFLTVCAHHVFSRRDLSILGRLRGPLVAGLAGATVSVPWYALIYAHLGPRAIDHLFLHNSVRRAASANGGGGSPFWHYAEAVWHSSRGFKFALPAAAWGLACMGLGWNRRTWGLLAVPALVFLLAISSAATKYQHYSYPVFPLLAVMTAAMLLTVIAPPWPGGWSALRGPWRAAAALGVLVTVAAVRHDFKVMRSLSRHAAYGYPPMRVHDDAAPELAAGRGRLVMYCYPREVKHVGKFGLQFHDQHYTPLLTHMTRAASVAELKTLLADGKPAVVFIPTGMDEKRLLADGFPAPDRLVLLRSDEFAYPAFLYNGAEQKLGLADLIRETEAPPGKAVRPPPGE